MHYHLFSFQCIIEKIPKKYVVRENVIVFIVCQKRWISDTATAVNQQDFTRKFFCHSVLSSHISWPFPLKVWRHLWTFSLGTITSCILKNVLAGHPPWKLHICSFYTICIYLISHFQYSKNFKSDQNCNKIYYIINFYKISIIKSC